MARRGASHLQPQSHTHHRHQLLLREEQRHLAGYFLPISPRAVTFRSRNYSGQVRENSLIRQSAVRDSKGNEQSICAESRRNCAKSRRKKRTGIYGLVSKKDKRGDYPGVGYPAAVTASGTGM
ncbi:hypothetical protein AVEN_79623-1 [Araneus ventricosus]|uniref:Uncharacterized protein n=1 Tax=Araneus ventricosus TaxID=182803 RepID=A0A4Y2Q0L7_ARAVE|nr:hypothetical protein AVEN_251711-1 [Araneus ventricosus]GBN57062.1 hypothetical protein AVEN_8758-1 [Araneus ventricosus]GBN57227.1 hypothetical protein AVEN_201379-1 [Araneus ventricosus]GBN58838.1 hypothetical protein AVEN_79623-1 [Araneus ventricosus]